MYKGISNRAKVAQNMWFGGGLIVHTIHSAAGSHNTASYGFPMLYHGFAHNHSHVVHKISAALTGVVGRFSAESTRPITTTTTFIYKYRKGGQQV